MLSTRPIVGITASTEEERKLTLSLDYIHAVAEAGGIPVVLPNLAREEDIRTMADALDGLLLSGGGDIDPAFFGEEPHPRLGSVDPERDRFETAIIREMMNRDKPILAICRGCQILNIAAGGDLYQDIYSQADEDLLQHGQKAPRWHASHFVTVEEGTLLHRVIRSTRIKVNSFHHQAVRQVPEPFRISAVAGDGIIEAVESRQHSFILGVQWHPECMASRGDGPSRAIFAAFVRACGRKRNGDGQGLCPNDANVTGEGG